MKYSITLGIMLSLAATAWVLMMGETGEVLACDVDLGLVEAGSQVEKELVVSVPAGCTGIVNMVQSCQCIEIKWNSVVNRLAHGRLTYQAPAFGRRERHELQSSLTGCEGKLFVRIEARVPLTPRLMPPAVRIAEPEEGAARFFVSVESDAIFAEPEVEVTCSEHWVSHVQDAQRVGERYVNIVEVSALHGEIPRSDRVFFSVRQGDRSTGLSLQVEGTREEAVSVSPSRLMLAENWPFIHGNLHVRSRKGAELSKVVCPAWVSLVRRGPTIEVTCDASQMSSKACDLNLEWRVAGKIVTTRIRLCVFNEDMLRSW